MSTQTITIILATALLIVVGGWLIFSDGGVVDAIPAADTPPPADAPQEPLVEPQAPATD